MLFISIALFFIIKAFFLLLFYFKQMPRPLLIGFYSCLAVVPFITLLYHSTDFDFLIVFTGMIALDAFLFYRLVQPNFLKAIPAAILINLFGIILFFMING